MCDMLNRNQPSRSHSRSNNSHVKDFLYMHFQVKMTFWGNKEPFLLFDLMKYEMYQSSSFFVRHAR